MRRLLLIANPSASAFTGALHRRVVDELGESFDVTPVWPTTPDLATAMAADAASDGFDVVVAMGGDGVVHRVANGIANTTTALGIIPAGTTNVLARILGMPSKPAKAAGIIATAPTASIPLAHLATDGRDGARSVYAVFAAGIGYDAEMVQIADQRPFSKLYFGSLHYARSAATALFSPSRRRAPNLRVDCDGDRVDAVSVMVQVHDPYTYFGRVPLRLAPQPESGLTVLAIESLGAARAVGIASRAALGRRLDRIPGVHVWHDPTKLVIEADPPSRFQADGELLGSTDGLEITEVPDGLRVITPAAETSVRGS